MTNQETIERWAKYLIPAVFKAEEKLQREHPEWKEKLRNITKENTSQVAEEYCRAIAEEIVLNAEDADKEMCGNCCKGEPQPDGSYCRCLKDGKFHKHYDTACMDYEKGGMV